ncbi:MAG: hypothetical protein J2O39_07355, partial [Acidimicrobiales bacterium]|nr:hypothetical protein [Acidimicrobiales bacterium]
HPGCPEAPMSEDAVLSKFAENTSWFLGPDAAGIGARLVAPPGAQPLRHWLAELMGPGPVGAGPGGQARRGDVA